VRESRQAQSRFEPPVERRIVQRTRLLDELDAAEARTLLLVAPAGYGKTTLARQWLERTGGAWLHVTAATRDIPVLARDLGAAIAEIARIELRRIESALKASRTSVEQARDVARVILRQVVEPVGAWLVVDDYHLLAGSPAEELIGTLERSGRFRLLVTSREHPAWATSRRRVHLDLFELGVADLALDEREVAELLPPTAASAALREQARGWPAVIGLAAYSESSDMELSPDALSATLYDYLAEELFERAAPSVQRTLTAIALLPPLESDELTEFLFAKAAAAPVLATGLAYEGDRGIEVHPLARSFLLTKVRARPDVDELVRRSVELAVAKERWDEAFALIVEFAVDDRLEELITTAYPSLIETGRIATLDSFGHHGAARGCVSNALLDLIAAEVALRDGQFDGALALGEAAARGLPDGMNLNARGLIVAGRAAHLVQRYEQSLNLHAQAATLSVRASDVTESAWGRCLAALNLEHDDMQAFVREFEALSVTRPEDRLHVLLARLHLRLLSVGLRGDLPGGQGEAEAGRLMAVVTDPWIRTAWGNTLGYSLVLQAHYDEARAVLLSTLADAEEFGLAFARPHIETSLAAAELGLRHFARTESLLRKVEGHPAHTPGSSVDLNARAIRARLYLAQQRPQQAIDLTEGGSRRISSRAFHGELLATQALAYGVKGQRLEALECGARAEEATSAVETRLLVAAARTLVGDDQGDRQVGRETLLDMASDLGVWDGVVCAARSSPSVAAELIIVPGYAERLRALFQRSHDNALVKSLGQAPRPFGACGVLSPREREVLDLVSVGLRNKEIAAALFISPATVKVHVQHLCEKLGARTRAEAVARYAEMATGEATNS
jgi:ATP/maltotriose-dependent transcriptional regulator MalT